MDLATSLRYVRGVGPQRAERLAAAGYRTAGDLLFHLPHRWVDRRRLARIAEVAAPGA
jgi:ATP-dependent DNA helicase RecG